MKERSETKEMEKWRFPVGGVEASREGEGYGEASTAWKSLDGLII